MTGLGVPRSQIKPGWIVTHRHAHEATVTDVREEGVVARHMPQHAGRNEPEYDELIPWREVTAVRPPDRFGQIIERLKAIRSGALRRDDESFETLTNDALWLVAETATLTDDFETERAYLKARAAALQDAASETRWHRQRHRVLDQKLRAYHFAGDVQLQSYRRDDGTYKRLARAGRWLARLTREGAAPEQIERLVQAVEKAAARMAKEERHD